TSQNWQSKFTADSTDGSVMYTQTVEKDTTIKGTVAVNFSALTENTDENGTPIGERDALMVSAMLVDIAPAGKTFPAFNIAPRSSYVAKDTIAAGGAWMGGSLPNYDLTKLKASDVTYKIISRGWMDLCNPGAGFDSHTADTRVALDGKTYHDYTIYLQSTVYEVEAGHTLALVIYAYEPGMARYTQNYQITIDNSTVSADIPVNAKRSTSGSSSSGSSSSRTYSVTVEDSQNGTVTASPKRAEKGDTVSVTASANSGYAVSGVTVKTAGGDTVKVTDNGNGKYTFTMPAANVTVTAAFSKPQTTVSFADVSSDSYCADAVKWAVENGVTNGTTATTFSTNAACTRGQIVTFLWRAAGSPAPKTTVNPFTDVAADAYYAKAVLWAVENGITNGTTATTFSPDAPCTRAQAVTFLFRGAIANGLEAVTLQELISGFSDAASLPGYAVSAMNWALANGIVQGNGGALMPNNTCTRGQIVTFLYRASK
ncbi:MAG: S-layer homology domain-containing protein, partial [Dysosmobacter sp.]